ncbi:hypothetical protein [Paulownia witches'-broom phytoplasma]|uniref:hypothetical protein n=1 Tax=Paulownia witches'-broom phytoplasma TaxID=39647 RepID=UPI002D1F230A|nr:hypothetical protein PAWBP_7430 [Paulownia witches'-broom phytoplasma]
MELFYKLIIIGFLLFIFIVTIPLCMYFYQSQQNKKRITKINLKSTIFFYYIKFFLGALVIGIISFIWYMKVKTNNQSNSHIIQPPQIETYDEWFQTESKSGRDEKGEYKYIPSYRIDYSEENKEKIKTIKASEIILEEIKEDGSKVKIQGTPMIKRKYTFYGIAGLGRGQHQEYEPTDLAPYVKNSFNEWNEPLYYTKGDELFYFHTYHKDKDSQFWDNMIVDHSNHYIEFNYKGPKYLLEEDKDFFMDEVNCPTNKKDEDNHVICKTYYLHFNPDKQYLTLYTKKFNTKK